MTDPLNERERVAAHEAGHAAAALAVGATGVRATIVPDELSLGHADFRLPYRLHAVVSLAGPLAEALNAGLSAEEIDEPILAETLGGKQDLRHTRLLATLQGEDPEARSNPRGSDDGRPHAERL